MPLVLVKGSVNASTNSRLDSRSYMLVLCSTTDTLLHRLVDSLTRCTVVSVNLQAKGVLNETSKQDFTLSYRNNY